MSNIVLIGAGQTGRGYLNRFFKDEKVTFLDIDSELIERLQQEKKYNIFFGKPGTLLQRWSYILFIQSTETFHCHIHACFLL